MAFTDPSWMRELSRAFTELHEGSARSANGGWKFAGGPAGERSLLSMGGRLYRLVDHEAMGAAFALSLMGFQYAWECRRRHWPGTLQGILEGEVNRGRFYLLCFEPPGRKNGSVPIATIFEDSLGDCHLLETVQPLDEGLWAALTVAAHTLEERRGDPVRFDDHGDFLVPGGSLRRSAPQYGAPEEEHSPKGHA